MWPSREDFLSNFKWREMEEELKGDVGEEQSQEFSNKMQQLFWDYKGVFWDGNWKNWTRARIQDLDIGLIEGSEPAIDKFRPMNEEKQVALKEFMNNLIAGGVIEKGTGMTPWVANPHVIRERRETNEGPIFKWRFCLDYRQQNKLTRQFSYKLPLKFILRLNFMSICYMVLK